MDADGSNRRQVTRTRDPAFDFDPSLSPDGRRVVFRTSRGRYAPDLMGTGVQEGVCSLTGHLTVGGSRSAPCGPMGPRRSSPPILTALMPRTPGWSEGVRRMVAGRVQARVLPPSWRRRLRRVGHGRRWQPPAATDPHTRQGLPGRLVARGQAAGLVYSSFRGNHPLPNWYLMNSDGTGIRSLPQLQGAGDPIDVLRHARRGLGVCRLQGGEIRDPGMACRHRLRRPGCWWIGAWSGKSPGGLESPGDEVDARPG
jgi:hypothetical protein